MTFWQPVSKRGFRQFDLSLVIGPRAMLALERCGFCSYRWPIVAANDEERWSW